MCRTSGVSAAKPITRGRTKSTFTSDNNCCVSNPWNLKYDKGSGALDRRHILSINYVYSLPFFDKSTGLLHALVGGWEIAGTSIAETGLVQTVTGAGGITGSGNTYDPVGLGGGYTVRPNVSGERAIRSSGASGSIPPSFPTWCPCGRAAPTWASATPAKMR